MRTIVNKTTVKSIDYHNEPIVYRPSYLDVDNEIHLRNPVTNIDLSLMMDAEAAYELYNNLQDSRYDISDTFPGKVIVKCQHCGQWCARKTACIYCGAPVD